MDNEKFGKLIKDARLSKSYTQKEIASRLGITDKAVSKWECGRSFPDITMIESISRELDISVNQLVGIADNSKEESIMINKLNKKIKIRLTLFVIILCIFIFKIIAKITFGNITYWKIRDFAGIIINIVFLFLGGASLFFASPFCRKLQNKNVGCCKAVL